MKRLRIDDVPTAPNRPTPSPSLSDSVPRGTMTLCGIVRTANGYALCTAEIEPGAAPKVLSVKCGPSQSHMEYIAMEHKKLIAVLARKVA